MHSGKLALHRLFAAMKGTCVPAGKGWAAGIFAGVPVASQRGKFYEAVLHARTRPGPGQLWRYWLEKDPERAISQIWVFP